MRDYAFGNLVTKLRTELGFSQFQLGRLIGVSDKAVSKWENGNAKPRVATCCRLADILGVSLDELLSAAGYAAKAQELPEPKEERVLMQEEKTKAGRQDLEPEKRIELHVRTGMSSEDGIASAAQYISRAAEWGHPAIAVTDFCVVQSLPEGFREAARKGIKFLPGCEGFMLPTEDSPVEDGYPVMLLATSRTGITHLNQLITLSHTRCYKGLPCMPREWIVTHREGLLIGSACDGGEIAASIPAGMSGDALVQRASFYDYLEVEPAENRTGDPAEQERLRQQISDVVRLGRETGIPVVAVSNARYVDPEDAVCRAVLRYNTGLLDAEPQPPYHLRTTSEMLEAFRFLGEAVAREIVILAPGRIADRVEDHLTLLPEDGRFHPVLPEAKEILTEMAMLQARSLYGQPLPPQVGERLDAELRIIDRQESWTVFEIARLAVEQSRKDRFPVGIRGAIGSSLVAWLTGISEINPLEPHYRCPACRSSDFRVDTVLYRTGADLPDRDCPVCGQVMDRDGFSIPFEILFGLDGKREPDIDLNLSGEEQSKVHECVRDRFGREHVFHAGTIGTLSDRNAGKFVRQYFRDHHLDPDSDEAAGIRSKLAYAVKTTTGQMPAGLVILPADRDINEFTPVQFPANNTNASFVSTHYDFFQMNGALLKMDLLGHNTPTVLHLMRESTGIELSDVPLSDKRVLSLFTSPMALGVTAQQILSETGSYGIPEFSNAFVRGMLTELRPSTVEELIRISGLSHGTGIWSGNAQNLIASGTATCRDVPALRDDIMNDLIRAGMGREAAYRAMESVRLGRGVKPETADQMRKYGIPEWYIQACSRCCYLFPRAHAAAYVKASLQIAWFKLYHPEAFYRAWFSVHLDDMEETDLLMDVTHLRRALLAARSDTQKTDYDEESWRAFEGREQRQRILELILEMRVRGTDL
ncbi:MAG: PHP domain-containing protein [Clostridia bacterium]|nr:PHP domain-containing protein [Clostridia bacterium]